MSCLTSNTDWWIDDATNTAGMAYYTYTHAGERRTVYMNADRTIDLPIPLGPEIDRLHAEQHPIDPDWKDLI